MRTWTLFNQTSMLRRYTGEAGSTRDAVPLARACFSEPSSPYRWYQQHRNSIDGNVPKRWPRMLGLHPKPLSTTTYPCKRSHSGFLLLYVLVGTLGAVEQVHLLLLVRSRSAHVLLVGIRLRVRDPSRFTKSRDSDTMPEANEECGGGGDKDIAAKWSVKVLTQSIGNSIREVGFLSRFTHTRILGGCLR
jgi:hypothetical protein